MPSRAIGMGMCPRCGKPGTVVIKAGNYVYVKHGNTWHYIGTIDKVNLNKILIKNEEIITKSKWNLINNKYLMRDKKLITTFILLSLAAFLLSMISILIFYHSYQGNINNVNFIKNYNSDGRDNLYLNISNMVTLTGCHVMNIGNNIYQVVCGNVSYTAYQDNISIEYINNSNKSRINFINTTSFIEK